MATVSTLSNVQNSLFVPDLGNWINRMPLINLTGRSPMPANMPTNAKGNGNSAHNPNETCVECDERAESIRRMRLPSEPGEKEGMKEKIKRRRRKEANGHDEEVRAKDVEGENTRDGVPATIAESPAAEEAAMALVGAEEIRRKKRARKAHPLAHAPHSARSARSSSSASSIGSSETNTDSDDSGLDSDAEMRRRERLMRSTSTVRGEYAVLPAGIAWDDWTEQERAELDDYVRHLMHSRRERFRRRLRGFGQFVSRRELFFVFTSLDGVVVRLGGRLGYGTRAFVRSAVHAVRRANQVGLTGMAHETRRADD